LFCLTVTWKFYFDLDMFSKIVFIQKNVCFCIWGLITVFIAVIQMSLGGDIGLLRVKIIVNDNKYDTLYASSDRLVTYIPRLSILSEVCRSLFISLLCNRIVSYTVSRFYDRTRVGISYFSFLEDRILFMINILIGRWKYSCWTKITQILYTNW